MNIKRIGLLVVCILVLLSPTVVFAQKYTDIEIIDMHEHFTAGADFKIYSSVAKKLGITKTLFVPTGKGPDNAGYRANMRALLKAQKEFPDSIIAFCSVDSGDSGAPKIFERCLKAGSAGLKLMTGHPDFYTHPFDSEIMVKLFEVARKYDVPVLFHASIINLPAIKGELVHLLDQFPDVRVQFAHYCSAIMHGVHLDQCGEFLDKYPNLYVDISMGGGMKYHHSYMMDDKGSMQQIKDFLLRYQNRILYGTDVILAGGGKTNSTRWLRARILCDLRLHQEGSYRCLAEPDEKNTLLPGFGFSKDILNKLYTTNPKTFLKMDN